jgi:predicted transcriptional regulator
MAVHLTPRELDVMAVLWQLGDATVTDVKEQLADDLAYPTVLTVLRTLELKGHIRHETEGKAFRWFPVTKPDEAGDGALKRLIAKVYKGSRELLISRVVADRNVSAEELRRIRRVLNERLKEIEK